MSNITVNIKRLDPTVELPKYAHPTDAGLDLRSNEDCILKPFERRLVSTGWPSPCPMATPASSSPEAVWPSSRACL